MASPPRAPGSAPPPHAASPAVPPLIESLPPAGSPEDDLEASAQRAVGTRIVQLDPERERKTRIVAMPSAPSDTRERRGRGGRDKDTSSAPDPKGRVGLSLEESAVSRDLDATLARAKYTYAKLDRIDRLLLYSLLVMFVATLLPWVYVPGEGLLSGIQDVFGAIAAGSAAVGVGAFATRAWRRLRGGSLVLLELGASFGVAAASAYRALTITGSPYIGLYISVVAAVWAFVLGLARLVR